MANNKQSTNVEQNPEKIFDLTKKIGKGGYGEVYSAIHVPTGKVMAVKIMEIESELDAKSVADEIKLIKRCDCPHIVKYYGSYFYENKLWIAIEFCDGGSALDIIRKLKKTLTEEQIRSILKQVVDAVNYIHNVSPPICHRDIKAGNILLNAKGEVKVADFGISAQITTTMKKLNTQIGSPYWMAPEVLNEEKYDLKVDIWSIGILTIELAQGKPPWFEQGALRALFLISTKPPPTLEHPEEWSANFIGFLARCLVRDPINRPTAKELSEQPFLQTPVNYSVLSSLVEEASLISTDHNSEGGSTGESANSSEAFDPIQPEAIQKEEKPTVVSWMDVLRETKSSPITKPTSKKPEEKKEKEKDNKNSKKRKKKYFTTII